MDLLWVEVGHGLQRVDQVHELEPTVNVLIVAPYVADDVLVLELRGAFVLAKENSEVVGIDLAM